MRERAVQMVFEQAEKQRIPVDGVRRDEWLSEHVRRVWRDHRQVYGVRKVWKQLAAKARPSRAVPWRA